MPEKKWVFDTVVLSNFFLSNSEFILEKRYRGRGIITWQVYDEISIGISDHPELKHIDEFIDGNVFEFLSLTRKENWHFLKLIGHIVKGEATCISLHRERDAIVVTDDRTARKQCARLDIPVSGTVGVLNVSMMEGAITSAEADDILYKMINAGFYSPAGSVSEIAGTKIKR